MNQIDRGKRFMNEPQADSKAELILQQQIEALPKEIKPRRDLWAGIDHAIENGEHNRRKKPLQRFGAIAAGLAIFGWLSWLTINIDNSVYEPQINNTDESLGSGIVADSQNEQGLEFVSAMSQSYEEQKQALLVQYDGQQSVVNGWQKQLAELDGAAEAIKKALLADPSNAQLIKMLQQIYQQQLDLIKMVNRSPWQQI